MGQSPNQCCGLSVDDAQQRDCWHHHFPWLVCVQSVSCKISASLTNVGGLAVGAFDLVNCSLSVVGFVPFFNVGQCQVS